MKTDFHVHVEEGPYSLQWLSRTTESLRPLVGQEADFGQRAWLDQMAGRIADRVRLGPYSREWLDLYRMRAKQSGLRMVGIVEHLYRFWEYTDFYEKHLHLGEDQLGQVQRRWLQQVASDSLSSYFSFVEEERQRWAEDGIELKIGIELDYFPGEEELLSGVIQAFPWDLCIGAVHFVQGWGFTIPQTQQRFDQMELQGLYSRYFDLVEQAVRSGLFDLIAHIDGIKAFGRRPPETFLLPYYQRVARALKQWDVATEINTALYYHYPIREMSPSIRFLEVMAQHGVVMTMASGAYFPDQLGLHLEEARAQLKRAGYGSIAVFERRKRRLEPLD